MPEPGSASLAVLDSPSLAAAPALEQSQNAQVLDLYAATLARSLNERNAFEAAVRMHRSHNPDLPEEAARQAVANLICRKA